MPAYVIVETDITDPVQYEQYKAASPDAVAAGGGRFVVRGGELAVLEGDWRPSRLVILEFEDLEAAKQWYSSDQYQEVIKLRAGAARTRLAGRRAQRAICEAESGAQRSGPKQQLALVDFDFSTTLSGVP